MRPEPNFSPFRPHGSSLPPPSCRPDLHLHVRVALGVPSHVRESRCLLGHSCCSPPTSGTLSDDSWSSRSHVRYRSIATIAAELPHRWMSTIPECCELRGRDAQDCLSSTLHGSSSSAVSAGHRPSAWPRRHLSRPPRVSRCPPTNPSQALRFNGSTTQRALRGCSCRLEWCPWEEGASTCCRECAWANVQHAASCTHASCQR